MPIAQWVESSLSYPQVMAWLIYYWFKIDRWGNYRDHIRSSKRDRLPDLHLHFQMVRKPRVEESLRRTSWRGLYYLVVHFAHVFCRPPPSAIYYSVWPDDQVYRAPKIEGSFLSVINASLSVQSSRAYFKSKTGIVRISVWKWRQLNLIVILTEMGYDRI